jgi:histone H1/5
LKPIVLTPPVAKPIAAKPSAKPGAVGSGNAAPAKVGAIQPKPKPQPTAAATPATKPKPAPAAASKPRRHDGKPTPAAENRRSPGEAGESQARGKDKD